jgi:ER membrane protein complex subunit 4
MYMTGSSLQIFSIFMVFTLFKTPITALINIQRSFAPFETPGNAGQMNLVKIVFVITNSLLLALGIWKVNQMGLLPYVPFLTVFGTLDLVECMWLIFMNRTTRSDWLAWEAPREALERAYPAYY